MKNYCKEYEKYKQEILASHANLDEGLIEKHIEELKIIRKYILPKNIEPK